MEYERIYEDDYEEQMKHLIELRDQTKLNIENDLGTEYENKLIQVNSKIDELNIRMIKTLRDRMIKLGLIDPEKIYDKDLTNFKNLSQDIRGKMLENIIATTDD
jgi:hypothetical protein